MFPKFPENCIRGIDKNDYINPSDNTVRLNLYLPDSRTVKTRSDSCAETSINWEDDVDVVDFTLKYRENNKLLFPHGAVRLPKDEIDRINANPATQNSLAYERRPVDGNSYHGNILFLPGLSQTKQNMLASVLAAYSSKVLRLSE
jgi:hypothetical protein